MAKPSNQVPPAAEFNKLRAHLQAKGAKAADLAQAVGGSVNGRQRKVLAANLAAWLRDRPKQS